MITYGQTYLKIQIWGKTIKFLNKNQPNNKQHRWTHRRSRHQRPWKLLTFEKELYLHMFHLVSLAAELGQVSCLLAVVVHMNAQAWRVPHTLLANIALEGPFSRVVLVPNMHLQVVTIGEEPVAGRALHTPCLDVPTWWDVSLRNGIHTAHRERHKQG